jgi:hypothetical protein
MEQLRSGSGDTGVVEGEGKTPAVESATPKVQTYEIKRTGKKGVAPKFNVGELLPWKTVWFQLVSIEEDQQGRKLLTLTPKIQEVK